MKQSGVREHFERIVDKVMKMQKHNVSIVIKMCSKKVSSDPKQISLSMARSNIDIESCNSQLDPKATRYKLMKIIVSTKLPWISQKRFTVLKILEHLHSGVNMTTIFSDVFQV